MQPLSKAFLDVKLPTVSKRVSHTHTCGVLDYIYFNIISISFQTIKLDKHQIRSLLALMEMQDFSMTGFGYKSNDTHVRTATGFQLKQF